MSAKGAGKQRSGRAQRRIALPEPQEIGRIDRPTRRDFYHDYHRLERPVVLTGVIDSWPARKSWSINYFKTNFGDTKVEVEAVRAGEPNIGDDFFANTATRTMRLSEYADAITKPTGDVSYYLAQCPIFSLLPDLVSDCGSLSSYFPELPRRLKGRDTLFWMGPEGSISHLHIDYDDNFLVQITGRKRFALYPRSKLDCLYMTPDADAKENSTVAGFSPIDYENPDLERFPKFIDAVPITGELGPGDILFIPREWAHYVKAEEPSISLNYWWCTWSYAIRRLPAAVVRRANARLRKILRD